MVELSTLISFAVVLALLKAAWNVVNGFLRVSSKSKFVLITGCDTGFGRLAALRLQAQGMRVLAACLTESGGISLRDEAQRNGPGSIQVLTLDVTKDASVARAAQDVKAAVGDAGLHAVINNAGVLRGGLLDTMPVSDWQFQWDVNVLGIARVTKAVFPLLFAARGRIINVASVAGVFATESTMAYNASKFAVVGITDAMRRELSLYGIKVVMILPGIMRTPLWEQPLSDANQKKLFDDLTAEQKAFYGGPDFFAKAFAEARGLVQMVNGNPELVVTAMENAVLQKYPPTRYYVGHDTWAFRLLAALPDSVSDFLWASRHVALGTKPLLPAAVVNDKRKN